MQDTVLIADTEKELWEFLDKVVKESRKNGQTINRNKNI